MGISADGAPSLVVWNLVTASVWWSAAVAAACRAVDPLHGAFAVALPPEPLRRWIGVAALPAPPTGPSASRPTMNGMNGSAAAARQPHAAAPANGLQMNGRRVAAAAGRPRMNGTSANGRPEAQSGSDEDAAQDSRQRADDAVSRLQASAVCAGGAFWYDEGKSTGDERALAHESGGSAVEAALTRGSASYGGGGGSVLLFDPGCPTPKQAWLLPRSAPVSLHLLTHSRRYALLRARFVDAGSMVTAC